MRAGKVIQLACTSHLLQHFGKFGFGIEGIGAVWDNHRYDCNFAFADGREANMHNMAEDVAAFLMWTAEPHMMARKSAGFKAVLILLVLTSLLYLTNKRIWSGVKGKKHA